MTSAIIIPKSWSRSAHCNMVSFTWRGWAVMFFAIAWLLVVNGIVGFLVWKVHTMASLGRLDFKENVVPVPKAFAFPGGRGIYMTFLHPLKIMIFRIVKWDPPTTDADKGAWSGADKELSEKEKADNAAFMGGYAELFAAYEGNNVLFFAWKFAEQFFRIIMLTVVPKGGQEIGVIFITAVTCILLTWRSPYKERNLNALLIFGKLNELYTFMHLTMSSNSGGGQAILAAAPVILMVNQLVVIIMTLLSVFDSIVKAKNGARARVNKAKDRVKMAREATRKVAGAVKRKPKESEAETASDKASDAAQNEVKVSFTENVKDLSSPELNA